MLWSLPPGGLWCDVLAVVPRGVAASATRRSRSAPASFGVFSTEAGQAADITWRQSKVGHSHVRLAAFEQAPAMIGSPGTRRGQLDLVALQAALGRRVRGMPAALRTAAGTPTSRQAL